MRLVYATPTWDDLVKVTLDEIRAFVVGPYEGHGVVSTEGGPRAD